MEMIKAIEMKSLIVFVLLMNVPISQHLKTLRKMNLHNKKIKRNMGSAVTMKEMKYRTVQKCAKKLVLRMDVLINRLCMMIKAINIA